MLPTGTGSWRRNIVPVDNDIGETALTDCDRELDATGLSCPLPILKCKKLLNQMAAGETVRVLATDPGAPADFADFAEQSGHRLLESSELDGVYRFVMEKSAARG